MDILHLVVALGALALGLRSAALPIFNRALKDELDALKKDKEALEQAASRFDKRLQEKDKKLDKLRAELDTAKGDLDRERKQARGSKGESRKNPELEAAYRRKEQQFERRLAESANVLKEIQQELLEHKERSAAIAEELAGAKTANDTLSKQVDSLSKVAQAVPKNEPPKPEPEPEPRPASTAVDEDETAELRKQLKKARKDLKAYKFSEATLKRKLEHNRRAYMVTMMQLDLAQDELCLLKTGKPRRQTALAQQQQPGIVDSPTTPEEAEPETVADLADPVAPEEPGDVEA